MPSRVRVQRGFPRPSSTPLVPTARAVGIPHASGKMRWRSPCSNCIYSRDVLTIDLLPSSSNERAALWLQLSWSTPRGVHLDKRLSVIHTGPMLCDEDKRGVNGAPCRAWMEKEMGQRNEKALPSRINKGVGDCGCRQWSTNLGSPLQSCLKLPPRVPCRTR